MWNSALILASEGEGGGTEVGGDRGGGWGVDSVETNEYWPHPHSNPRLETLWLRPCF